ncbi:tumor necrosis factor receptor superfamily member 11A [Aplochiton taeniatus]
MRASFSTNWIFRGWITNLLITLCAQRAFSKPACGPNQYLKDDRCWQYVFEDCLGTEETKCRRCGPGEYQPGWTQKRVCERQKYCDSVKGFSQIRPSNPLEATPCQCKPGRQCSPINCEFCQRIPSCEAGYGLETNSETALKICRPCRTGFFSDSTSTVPCMQWTNCKALGRTERQPGSARSDVVCGPDIDGPFSSWVIVPVLSVITLLSLLFLLLFCYKDKLKLLSVNLRSCVQSLKRTRIQQETLGPLYHSRAGGGMEGPGGPECSLCETTSLIQQAPHSPLQPPQTYPSTVKVAMPDSPLLERKLEEEERKGKEEEKEEEEGWGSSEPEEVSGDEGGACASPLWAGSCVCVQSVREPLEVGENEDCSQAVSPGALGPCYCGGAEGDKEGGRGGQGEGEAERLGQEGAEEPGKSAEVENAAAAAATASPTLSLASLLHAPSPVPASSLSPELCPPLTQARSEPKDPWTHSSNGTGEGLHSPTGSTGSTPTSESPPSLPSKGTSADPSETSLSVGDLYSERSPESSRVDRTLFSRDSGVEEISSRDSELECPPESLRSQLAEPGLTSGQVTGNNNTTFISNGQVMNFSGEVIVVYVGQTSPGSGGPVDAFGSPVQEQATVPLFERSLDTETATAGNPIAHNPRQTGNLPVQEVTGEWPEEK